jgi:hypothetical protein
MYKEHLAYAQTPERTASIMVDEASAVHKGLLYDEVFPQNKSWYSMNSQTEMADFRVMVILLHEQLGWNYPLQGVPNPMLRSLSTPESVSAFLVDSASSVHKRLLYTSTLEGTKRDTQWRLVLNGGCRSKMVDTLAASHRLCGTLHWSILDLETVGTERFLKRMEELKKGRQE